MSNTPFASALTQYAITVLLVDDQPIVAAAVKQMLAPEKDIVFHYCPDPAKALPMAAEIAPTVILQDLVMPDIDSLTLVRFYRNHPKLKDVPVIVLSSKEEAVTKADAFATGANDYLVKLPDRIELIARIRYHSRGYINLLQRNEAYDALLESQQALAAELARAAEYVVSLLPPPISSGPATTQWRYVPSTQLGGDAFGFHWLDPEHFAIYLLDVCGHGVGAALLSVSAINVIRSQSLPHTDFHDPEQVLAALNDTFQMEHHNNLYFTLWYGVYHAPTGRLRMATAGHPPALLFSPDGGARELGAPNMIIGGIPGLPYTAIEVTIPRPATLYVFSDGVYEIHRPSGELWSLAEMKEFLAGHAGTEGSEIDALYRYCQELGGEPVLEDDFSMLKVCFSAVP